MLFPPVQSNLLLGMAPEIGAALRRDGLIAMASAAKPDAVAAVALQVCPLFGAEWVPSL